MHSNELYSTKAGLMRHTRYALVFFVLFASVAVHADGAVDENQRTDTLRKACQHWIDDDAKGASAWLDEGICIGTLRTARDFVFWQPAAFKISLPGESTLEQLALVFAKYVDDHPERLHEHYMNVLLDSWRNGFPYAPATKKAPR